MKEYIGLSVLKSKPMNRLDYNKLRGWDLPKNENGSDEGFLTVDEGNKSNLEGFDGYVSWSPKGVFEKKYFEKGNKVEASYIQELLD